jgi:hypothetical protein
MDWKADLFEAKYHLATAKRMISSYEQYSEKRFLTGIINEATRATFALIRAFFIYEKTNKTTLDKFLSGIAPKYLDDITIKNIFKLLEIKKARKSSPIEFAKGEKIILLIEGKYRILTATRIKEFVQSVENAIATFPENLRQL